MTTIVGILSDTHEDIRMIRKAVRLLLERAPALVIHCGDIISPPVLEQFKGLPMRLVFGNNDGERSGLKKKCQELGFDEIHDTLTPIRKLSRRPLVRGATITYFMVTPTLSEMSSVAEPGLSIQVPYSPQIHSR
jgi:hypothetical protein